MYEGLAGVIIEIQFVFYKDLFKKIKKINNCGKTGKITMINLNNEIVLKC